ncbi:hypothetical protein AC481_04525 [miscellaneous Crenarchaeota group archaeon SMTZ-80]|nr:MAG: hypothetical protein AC481_04525 [miscellaneous Crenarchaeota group archaeon SMTZ-80]
MLNLKKFPSTHKMLISILLINLIILCFISETVYSQPPIPPPQEVRWNPPFGGAAGGRTHYEMAGWSTVNTLDAWTADMNGNRKNNFNADEKFYVYVLIPGNWLESYIWMYEYHQSNSASERWIVWMRMIGPGRFRFGPFYPQEFRPLENYTWKVWIYNPERDIYQDTIFSFTFGEEIPEYPNPALILIISLTILFFYKKYFIKYKLNQFKL